MTVVHATLGVLVLASSFSAGVWGALCWWRSPLARSFWVLLRIAQVVVVLQVVCGGTLVLLGHHPARLHMLYGLLPLVVSFFGEQLRLASADTVLRGRGLESSAEVRLLPASEQNALAAEIMRREVGVMTVSALVVCALVLRAAQAAGSI